MGPVIRRLILKNFRSVPSGRIDLDNPTFLVGRNGSGKSNIADAFTFIRETMVYPLHEVLDRRGGINNILHKRKDNAPENLGIAIECDRAEAFDKNAIEYATPEFRSRNIASARYAFEIKPSAEYGFEINREQCVFTRFDGNKGWLDRNHKVVTLSEGAIWGGAHKVIITPGNLALPTLGIFDDFKEFIPLIQTLSGIRVYSIEPSRLREMQDPDSGTSLKRDGANAASVIEEIKRHRPANIRRIEQFLSAIVPGISSVSTKRHAQKLTLEFTQAWENSQLNFEAFNMSDGTLRAFGLLLAIFQKEKPSMILVEEPEASLHPAATGAVLDLLHHASKQMQVVVSTHSPEVLDAKWIEDQHLRIVSWQKGATTVSGISEMSKKALQQHLMGAGELLRSEALTPTLFEDVAHSDAELFEEVS